MPTGQHRELKPATFSSSQLQELDEAISQILLRSRELHNTLYSKVAPLPDHILSSILEKACVVEPELAPPPWKHSSVFYGFPEFSAFTARTLSSVCTRWRLLLLSNPIVWSDVRVTIRRPENLLWMEACLVRSGPSPIGCTIQIDQPERIPGIDLTKVIARHQSAIRCLKVNPRTKEEFRFLTLGMDNLERLHIDAGAKASNCLPTCHLKKLRAVVLQNLHSVPPKVLFNITDLTLSDITFPVPAVTLVEMFQESQTLEVVRIIKTDVTEGPQRCLVSLPNLKLLCVSSSSPVNVLRMLSPLPNTSRVVLHGNPTDSAASGISELLTPFSMFGPKNPILTASISTLSQEASITFRTSVGATMEIITEANSEFCRFLANMVRRVSFPDLHSVSLNIEPAALGPTSTTFIRTFLSSAPWMTRLSFEGKDLCLHIGQVLNVTLALDQIVCPYLKCLDGTLSAEGNIADRLRSLSEALKRRPNIKVVILDVIVREEEVERIAAETHPLVEEMRAYGIPKFTFTLVEERG